MKTSKIINSNIVVRRKLRSREKAGNLAIALLDFPEEKIEKATEGKFVQMAKAVKMDSRDLAILFECSLVNGTGRAKAIKLPHLMREFTEKARDLSEIFEIMDKKERKMAECVAIAIYRKALGA